MARITFKNGDFEMMTDLEDDRALLLLAQVARAFRADGGYWIAGHEDSGDEAGYMKWLPRATTMVTARMDSGISADWTEVLGIDYKPTEMADPLGRDAEHPRH